MQLTVTNPEVQDILADWPGGVWPMRCGSASRIILIVKAPREMAQTPDYAEASAFIGFPSTSAMLLRMVW